MPVSNVKRGAALAALCLSLPLLAQAADGAAGKTVLELSAPAPAPAAAPVASPPAEAKKSDAFSEMTPRDVKVSVQELDAVDPGATGTLTAGHGGFATDLWAGAAMPVVQKVLPSLPAATTSHVQRGLIRKLLLTAASVPAGKALPGDNFVKLRADKLWAMGATEDLTNFLKGVPQQTYSPELRRLTADAALLAGDNALACDQLANLRGAGDDLYVQKLQLFCTFAAGKKQEGALAVDVMREQKINDPAYSLSADALAGIAPPAKLDAAFAQLSPISLAMARLAKIPLPESAAAASTSPVILKAIAQTASASLEARLLAAEKAEALGSLETDALRAAYEAVPFSPQELAAPNLADKSAKGRALLYRATAAQQAPAAKAELIAKALTIAGSDSSPAYFTAARLYAPQLAVLQPAPELGSFAYPAARALLAGGKIEEAKAWLIYLRGQALSGPPEAASAVAALWPLVRLSKAEDDRVLPVAALEAWRKARADQPGEQGQRRAAICYGLLTALGDKLPDEAWLPLYDGPAQMAGITPRPAIALGLRQGIEGQHLGQTLLMGLSAIGEAGAGQSDPTLLAQLVGGLHHLGLDAEARALAVEIAIANGV